MANNRRLAAAVVAGAVVLAGSRSEAGAASPAMVVRIVNFAGVPADELAEAQREAGNVFKALDVDVRWELDRPEAPGPGVFQVRLILLSGERAHRVIKAHQIGDEVLGLAVSQARVAYVFCNRILDAVADRAMSFVTVLARVMAHELGHVVLPMLKGHASSGIMHHDLLVRSGRREHFTAEQGREIRAFLKSSAASMPNERASVPARVCRQDVRRFREGGAPYLDAGSLESCCLQRRADDTGHEPRARA